MLTASVCHPLQDSLHTVTIVIVDTSAITSADGFGGTIDIFEGNAVGKVFCGIAPRMAGDEFCFTAKEGKYFCNFYVYVLTS